MSAESYNAPGHGIKHDSGKLQWSLVPMKYLRGMVQVLMFGAKKYSPDNWRAGMPWSQPYNALLRHMDAWHAGEDLDDETGLNHLDHALCELLFLRAFVEDHKALDDRYATRGVQ